MHAIVQTHQSWVEQATKRRHQRNMFIFVVVMVREEGPPQFHISFGFFLYFNCDILNKENKEKERCDDISPCIGSHP